MTNPHGIAYYGGNPFGKANITIIGVGAVGSWLAVSLAKQGATLNLVDFDTVAQRNLGTGAFYEMDLGLHKVDAMQAALGSAVDKVKTWRVTATNLNSTFTSKTALVIDATDNAETRNLIHRYCPIDCLHVGINEHYGSAVWDMHYKGAVAIEGEDSCEIPYSLNLILPLVGITVDMLAAYFTNGIKASVDFDLISGKKSTIRNA